MEDIKFNVKVSKYNKGSDYYDMTEEEIRNKCCVYECSLYFYDTIPTEEKDEIDVGFAKLYDIYNYECVAWWTWPDKHKLIMEERIEEHKALVRNGNLIR